jgi:hypothetical protein
MQMNLTQLSNDLGTKRGRLCRSSLLAGRSVGRSGLLATRYASISCSRRRPHTQALTDSCMDINSHGALIQALACWTLGA